MVRLSFILRDPLKLKQAAAQTVIVIYVALNLLSTQWWKDVPLGPPDIILGIFEAHKLDNNPNKIDLSVGAYRDNFGKPYVLPSVIKAEQNIVDKKLDKAVANDIGSEFFRQVMFRLAVGDDLLDRPHVSVQSVSGSGSIKIAAETISQLYKGNKLIFIPNPSWAYHAPIFRLSGLKTEFYRYYDERNHELDHSGMMTDLTHLPNNSIILFQMVGHNPTGADPTPNQWREISQILKDRNILIFIDMAYQGFGTGCLSTDAFPLKHFIEEGHMVVFAQSFSKNMGLYSVRVGGVTFMIRNEEEGKSILEQLKHSALCMYGQPPIHGSQIVEEIFRCPELKNNWENEVKMMHKRISSMRQVLLDKLHQNGSSRDWSHLMKQKGMFFYSGLSVEQCEQLINEHSIYVVKNGRMSVCGINEHNVDYLAHCLHKVTK
ncbi:CLUMA_CG020839, isoform A [Clunio marinus]|uniref:Aspartate aminotransferase, mitochondrial n=1 Tax=Clunio marinus TaxID=568069 RepID=A0A1J1J6D8_9DIPT|nr:CLUMA_CG020839, isoform A [Clunio marinus]